jgi:Fibronectin type III domain/IPT/TIG domain
VVPADTEYDYLPTPTITSVTTTSPGDATTWASEQGTTIATIDGKGFDSLGFLWTIDGNPVLNANLDFDTLSVSPTEVQVVINPHNPTSNPDTVKLTVQTLAGMSASWPLTYAGVPKVSGVSPQFGPDLGGTATTITGSGFQGVLAADGGQISYGYFPFDAATSQLTGYTATSTTSIAATTPENNPGQYFVQVCTITFCSQPNTLHQFNNSIFDFYQRGAPVVTSVSKKSGPASGGTEVEITGENLSDAVSVTFGHAVAEAASAPQILTNGSSTEIDAIVPPGKAGSTVNIRVATVESVATGHAASAPSAGGKFTYKSSVAAPPQDVTVKKVTTNLFVKWKAPASNGGHAITRYRVTATAEPNSDRKGAKKPPTVVVVTKHGTARSAVLTGLRGGWFYQVRVRAITSKGQGLAGSPNRDFFISDPA